MVAHPGQILQPHSLLPLRLRECRKCAGVVEKQLFHTFPTNIYKNQSEALGRNGISHLWKSRSYTVNVQLWLRLKAAAKTQISRGCKLQDASKSSNLALMRVIEKLSPVSFESFPIWIKVVMVILSQYTVSHFGFDSNSSFLFVNARRNSLMLHAFLVLAAGVPQVLLRTQYRVWMPADAKAAHVKPQHAWNLLQNCLASASQRNYNVYSPQAMTSMFGILIYFHFSTCQQGVSCGVFDWLAAHHGLQLHRADSPEFLWQPHGAACLDCIVSGAPEW